MQNRYYSNGKLLISGEYVVLDGANALAVPTKFGQDLIIKEGNNSQINWISKDSDGSIWFEGTIDFAEITNKNYISKTENVENLLLDILRQAYLLNPDYIKKSKGYNIETNLTFPKFWGLGTSSTLINNVAQWLQIDAFTLLENSFGGSGYDIASAQNDTAILYQLENGKPLVTKIKFNPDFADNLFFVYLNKKQSSKGAITSYYNNKPVDLTRIISEINRITEQMLTATTLTLMEIAMQQHENIISNILMMETVQEVNFSDYEGVVKSLGAWGGDFVLATAKENPSEYFRSKGFNTILTYKEMIL